MRKLLLTLVLLAMALSVCACESSPRDNGGDPKETKSVQPFHMKAYRYEGETWKKEDLTGDGTLSEEYEYLGTERSRKQYNGDRVESLTKWYYDQSGTNLLKVVYWYIDYPTESKEYDSRGRLIREQTKIEDDHTALLRDGYAPRLPEIYNSYMKKDALNSAWFDLTVEYGIRELKTEYKYKDDTDEYESITTVDEDGDTVARVLFGEGDIVLEAEIHLRGAEYSETYNSADNSAVWSYTMRRDAEMYEDGSSSGEKKYDEDGRCTQYTLRYADDDVNIVYVETTFEYDRDTYTCTIEYYTLNSNVPSWKYKYYYDSENRKVISETYVQDDQYGGMYQTYRETNEYYPNGNKKSEFDESYDYEMGGLTPSYSETYNEEGKQLSHTDYDYGKVSFRRVTTIVEEETEIGKVRHYTESRYEDGSDEGQCVNEYYEVCMHNMYVPTEEEWVTYSRTNYSDEQKITSARVTCDEQKGYIIRIDTAFWNDEDIYEMEQTGQSPISFREYDEQGRLTAEGSYWTPGQVYPKGYISYYSYEYYD